MRKERQGFTMGGVSPTDYMKISKDSYYQEYERPKGSLYSQALNDTLKEENPLDDPNRFKMNKQRQFLRNLRFGFIRDSYNRSLSNSGSQRRVKLAMYLVPGIVSFGLALSNYFQQSFGIYLKYQALVDSYYIHSKGGDKSVLSTIQDSQKKLLEQIERQQQGLRTAGTANPQ